MADENEINQANLRGRLHPIQRPYIRVITSFYGPFGLVVGAVALVAFMLPTPVNYDGYIGGRLGVLFFPLLAFGYGLWSVGRPLLDRLIGRVRRVTGWTTIDFDADTTKGTAYKVNIGKHTFSVTREVHAQVVPQRQSTGFVTLLTGQLVNVIPEQ